MSPILLTIVVVLVVVLGVAGYMDLKRRHLRDTKSAGTMGAARHELRRSDKERVERWTAGGS